MILQMHTGKYKGLQQSLVLIFYAVFRHSSVCKLYCLITIGHTYAQWRFQTQYTGEAHVLRLSKDLKILPLL